ncbi:MAG: hypothetical protein MUO37_09105, partial [Methyloceanibacter sp.]|nr:hypothetical protein [Methyloceanibacter sp.]
MAQHPNPVLLYHPDGYRVARQDLKGRHSAGEAFLTAFLEQAKDADIYGLCLEKGGAEHFAETIKAFGRGLKPNPISRTDIGILRKQAVLNLPVPGIAEEARTRSFLGDRAY